MTSTIRGADILARTLDGAGLRTIFTLSGNHIMPLFDAALDTRLELVHVRHEAAAVHMADAWARLTGKSGIALVTGGPGHANAVAALYTALAAESPLVLLSGHAATQRARPRRLPGAAPGRDGARRSPRPPGPRAPREALGQRPRDARCASPLGPAGPRASEPARRSARARRSRDGDRLASQREASRPSRVRSPIAAADAALAALARRRSAR